MRRFEADMKIENIDALVRVDLTSSGETLRYKEGDNFIPLQHILDGNQDAKEMKKLISPLKGTPVEIVGYQAGSDGRRTFRGNLESARLIEVSESDAGLI